MLTVLEIFFFKRIVRICNSISIFLIPRCEFVITTVFVTTAVEGRVLPARLRFDYCRSIAGLLYGSEQYGLRSYP